MATDCTMPVLASRLSLESLEMGYAENRGRLKRKAEQIELLWGEDLLDNEELVNNDPWAMANRAGVTVLADKEFVCGHVDLAPPSGEGGIVVSALFTSYFDGKFSFDVAVDHRYRGFMLGPTLTEIGMDQFREIQDMDPDAILELDVINPKVVPFLEREYGLKVLKEEGDHYIMGKNLNSVWFNEGVREGKDTAITCIAQNIPIVDPKDLVDDKVFDRVERELFIAGFKLGVTAGKHALFQREAVIRKCKEGDSEKGKPWCLYTHDGSKLLGRHPTKESARQQEEAIKAQGG